MNKLSVFGLVFACTVFTACATTPQQKAVHEQEKAERRLALQVKIAQQCDPIAAQMMQELPKVAQMSASNKAKFNQQYQVRVNNPTFKACYNMAFQKYQQQQMQDINELQWDINAGWFNNAPFNCETTRPEGMFWGVC